MRIAMVTAGAAGMYCGSCLRDNALVIALRKLGHDALLIPTYTPVTLDEPDQSSGPVLMGGINVYLEEKLPLYRYAPRWLNWMLDRKWLLNLAGRFAGVANYQKLGGLTISMLQGEHGHQKKELVNLVEVFRREIRPDVIILTNVLLSGIVPTLKRDLGKPIVATLQGDDIFLDALTESYRNEAIKQIRENDAAIDRYISTSQSYADHMAQYLGIDRSKIDVIPVGIDLAGHGPNDARIFPGGFGFSPLPASREGLGEGDGSTLERQSSPAPPLPNQGRGERKKPESFGTPCPGPNSNRRPTIGYFARFAPEKGFHLVVDAFIELRKTTDAKLKAGGWLGSKNQKYLDEQIHKLNLAGLRNDVEIVPSPDRVGKIALLQSIDLFSVPSVYREPKGMFLIEAWANGVPVVQPDHGCFGELVRDTGGGLLVSNHDPRLLAESFRELILDPVRRRQLGQAGYHAMQDRYTSSTMAARTAALLERVCR